MKLKLYRMNSFKERKLIVRLVMTKQFPSYKKYFIPQLNIIIDLKK